MIKALLVDDMQDELLLLQYLFKKYNVPIASEACEDSENACALLQNGHYDILITDIRMPLMDGLTLSKIAIERNPSIKIVIISGYGDFAYAQSAISLGVYEYLLKPIQPEDFIQLIQRLLTQIKKEQADHQLTDLRCAYSKNYLLHSLLHSPSKAEDGDCGTNMLLQNINALFLIKYPTALSDAVPFDIHSELLRTFGQYAWISLPLRSGMDAVFLERSEGSLLPDAQELYSIAEYIIGRYSTLFNKPCWVAFDAIARAEEIRSTYESLKGYLDSAIQHPQIRIFYRDAHLPEETPQPSPYENDIVQNKMKEVQSYIYQHYGEDLTLEKLSGIIYVHPDYLSRIFKRVTGHKLSSFIKMYRMEQAKIYLSNSYRKITEISSLVGYPNCSYFCQVFSDCFGISPEKYRQTHKVIE